MTHSPKASLQAFMVTETRKAGAENTIWLISDITQRIDARWNTIGVGAYAIPLPFASNMVYPTTSNKDQNSSDALPLIRY